MLCDEPQDSTSCRKTGNASCHDATLPAVASRRRQDPIVNEAFLDGSASRRFLANVVEESPLVSFRETAEKPRHREQQSLWISVV